MNLRRPRNYEDDFVGASIEFINVAIEAPAVLRSGVADRFLELALHDVAVEPAAYFLPEKNPRVLGGSSFRFAGATGSEACVRSLFQFYVNPIFGAQRDTGPRRDALIWGQPHAVTLCDGCEQ